MRRRSSCSSVEKTGTRPSSSTTSDARVADMDTEYHTAPNRHLGARSGAILIFMPGRRSARTPFAAASALAALLAAGSAVAAAAAGQTAKARAASSVLSSRQLWATINVCNPKDQPDIVGVRGSMPSDGHPHDKMYMS